LNLAFFATANATRNHNDKEEKAFHDLCPRIIFF